MSLDVELRDEGVEPQIDMVLLEPRPIMHADFFRGMVVPALTAQERTKQERPLIRHRDLVPHEHNRPLFVVLPDAFTCTDPSSSGADDKVVSTNHLPV